jgi:hypothetical protein
MKKARTIKSKTLLRISLKRDRVFVRDDFNDIGGYDQIGRALRELVASKQIIKIGYGLYAKSKISSISGLVVPQASIPDLAREALYKIGVKTGLSNSSRLYNSGKSTQAPTGRKIAVEGRISRKIGYDDVYISYEKAAR